jgi:hypothetical protein
LPLSLSEKAESVAAIKLNQRVKKVSGNARSSILEIRKSDRIKPESMIGMFQNG